MHIVVAGGHGQIAMHLHPLLIERGDSVRGLIRSPKQADDLRAAGAEPVLCDLEAETDLSAAIEEADAVLFAAGAGPGSGLVQIGEDLPRGEIPRADVAAVLAEVLDQGAALRRQFDLVSGEQRVEEAIRQIP